MGNLPGSKRWPLKLLAFAGVSACALLMQARAQNAFWGKAERTVAERDFFALVAMEDAPEIRHALDADPALKALRAGRDARLQDAASACHDAQCYVEALYWSDEEITVVAHSLQKLAVADPAFHRFIETMLRPTGKFVLYDGQQTKDLIASAWKDEANALNRILSVYGEGNAPLYARIDAMRYDPKSSEFVQFLQASLSLVLADEPSLPAFFSAAMKFAVLLLAANDRPDAGRFEPLLSTENQAAVQHAATINWDRYPYSVIVVPGEGPEQPDVPLSPLGRIRVEHAVNLYRQGKAPYILVSGGTVHPMLTKFDEAIEMRREMEKQWNVPANAILIDPYARHTTTNLRNASREIFQYRLPTDKPMLIASDAAQIRLILSSAFDARCLREMHFHPWKTLTQISPMQAVMLPNRQSLQEDAVDDPLDP